MPFRMQGAFEPMGNTRAVPCSFCVCFELQENQNHDDGGLMMAMVTLIFNKQKQKNDKHKCN